MRVRGSGPPRAAANSQAAKVQTEGRNRSSQNALCHGLARPASADFEAQIETLARRIAEDSVDPARLALAGSVPTHERLGPDDCEALQDAGNQRCRG